MCGRDFMTEKIGCMTGNTFGMIFRSGIPDSIKLNWRGEPLIHTQVVDFVARAKELGVVDVSLNTNGLLLNDDLITGFADAGLDWLIFSIDGATPKTYESIRRGGKFEKVFKNLISAKWIFTKMNANTKIRVQACKQPDNREEIDSGKWASVFHNYADELRIGNLFDPQGKRGLGTPIPETCTSPWQRITVSWTGDIFPCPADYQGHWKLGNIFKTSIKEAWHCERFNYIRHRLKKCGRKGHPACQRCSSYCQGKR